MVTLDFVLHSRLVGFSHPAAQDSQSLGAPAQGGESGTSGQALWIQYDRGQAQIGYQGEIIYCEGGQAPAQVDQRVSE